MTFPWKKTGLKVAALTSVVSLGALSAQAGNSPYQAYTPDMLPANPQSGMCYARVKIPAQFETRGQQVILEDGYSTLEVSPPQLAPRTENIMIKEASVEYRVRQPRYETITEQVMVAPGYEKLSVVPPQFETINQSLLMSPPRLVWKRGNPAKLRSQGYVIHSTAQNGYAGGSGVMGGDTLSSSLASGASVSNCGSMCEIWCLVEEPGVTKSFQRRVLKSEAQVQRIPVAPKYQTISKQVVADPGGVEEIPIPAKYTNITIHDLVDGGGERRVDVPARYGDVTASVPTSSERFEWRQVVCNSGALSQGSSMSHDTTQSYSQPQTYTQPAVPQPMMQPGYSSHAQGSTYSQDILSAYESSASGVICESDGHQGCASRHQGGGHQSGGESGGHQGSSYQGSGMTYGDGSGTTYNPADGTVIKREKLRYRR